VGRLIRPGFWIAVECDASALVASRHFEALGYAVLATESRPFHVLFAVLLWPVIQDPDDPMIQSRGFGERNAFDRGEEGTSIWTLLPSDFGASGYWARRGDVVERWLSEILIDEAAAAAFDELLPGSFDLRQYLWAHADRDVARARQIVSILPANVLRRILAYLAGDYWRRAEFSEGSAPRPECRVWSRPDTYRTRATAPS
jgi:hypothetical protein